MKQKIKASQLTDARLGAAFLDTFTDAALAAALEIPQWQAVALRDGLQKLHAGEDMAVAGLQATAYHGRHEQ